MMGGPLFGSLLFSIWVLFASRLRWREKLALACGGLVWPAVAGLISVPESALRTTMWVHGIPLAIFTVTAGLTCFPTHRLRTPAAIALLGLGWLSFGLVRNEGFDGEYYPEFVWRWSNQHEANLPDLPSAITTSPTDTANVPDATIPAEWPRFRGPQGDGVANGNPLSINWQATPPREVWRIPVGPGWGSFAFDQGWLFTQEQRQEQEVLSCYSALDGSLIWSHADDIRFTEVVSGAGPRSTPAVSNGRVFAMGGKGLLTCVQEADGQQIWQRNLVQDYQAPIPMWGFSGSPLIVDGLVVIFVGGNEDNGWMAFNADSGEKVWGIPSPGMNYTTAQLMTLNDLRCLVFCDGRGMHGADVATGKVLWTHQPAGWNGTPMVDVQQLAPSSLLVALGDGYGLTRVDVEHKGDSWSFRDVWTSKRLRPSFNDSLITDETIYGFNQAVFSCIDATTGERLWQGGRYGFGQALLLKNAGCIVVAAENGDAVLLKTNREKLEELGRIPVLDGKTWNHPIAVNNRLFLRNGQVAVCLDLSDASKGQP
jgi:outer membrane protein assembly factor BamB